jgi:hypothetical protein
MSRINVLLTISLQIRRDTTLPFFGSQFFLYGDLRSLQAFPVDRSGLVPVILPRNEHGPFIRCTANMTAPKRTRRVGNRRGLSRLSPAMSALRWILTCANGCFFSTALALVSVLRCL